MGKWIQPSAQLPPEGEAVVVQKIDGNATCAVRKGDEWFDTTFEIFYSALDEQWKALETYDKIEVLRWHSLPIPL